MPNAVTRLSIVALIILAVVPPPRVCSVPGPGDSDVWLQGPLNKEIKLTAVIAIGTVTKKQAVHEDPSDPEGITAYIYTVQIFRQLKGRVPQIIDLRTENDSGRYSVEVGERHLLLLNKEGQYFMADSCGNSSALPADDAVVKKVGATLARRTDTP